MKTFRSIQRVYFDDLDALNILHNVRYLLFIERARGELFQSLGFRWDGDYEDKWHVVAAHDIQYKKPVSREQEIAIELWFTHVGNTSVTLQARVTDTTGNTEYAVNSTRLVRLNRETSKPCPWSDHFRNAIAPYVNSQQTS